MLETKYTELDKSGIIKPMNKRTWFWDSWVEKGEIFRKRKKYKAGKFSISIEDLKKTRKQVAGIKI